MHIDEWGQEVPDPWDDPGYDQSGGGSTPPSPTGPPQGQHLNWPGSGAYWTDPKTGKKGQNPWIQSDEDYAKYFYNPQTGQLTLRSAMPTGGLVYSGTNPVAWASQQARNLPPTLASLLQIYEALKAGGVNVTRPTHAGGTLLSNDKLVIDGKGYDFIRSEGGADAEWIYDPTSYDDAPAGGGTLADLSNPSLLEKFNGQPPPGWTPPEGTESQGPFTAPTGDEVFNDPGYQFRSKEGQRPITQNASAMGLAKSMGTFKDLMAWNQSFASSEYGNVYNRKRDVYGIEAGRREASYARAWNEYLKGHDIFTGYQDAAFDKLYKQQNLGFQAAAA